ncbi:cinnamoyl-CoA reductase-like SNL6 [Cornus florida]|uniref:cinnamoyl-CoA reductase-like SNL6 n=1 Tax=Cornus florida TaxID=4283 RepID=UPI00289FF9BD|nr:cinnamoyl-CoA reductase-like SNL6 [Cornus florida]
MRVLQREESHRAEIEELRQALLSCAWVHRRKDEEEQFRGRIGTNKDGNDDVVEEKVVCVTSGVSFLGLAIVSKLLLRGYSVRVIVTNQGDAEKLREMEILGEMRGANNKMKAVVASLTEIESLAQAMEGCHGVFHTSALVDPAGVSGYTKSMADIEVKASECVMEACARTSSVRKCVLTSSLLACIWHDKSRDDLPSVINHECWSDESLCMDKKLWYALGKLRAEKAAWRVAEQRGLKLVTICPGLVTGSEFCHRNPTATIAYLKGVQEMYADGLLASVDVNRLAEGHVCVFEAMNKTAFGRYICFDRVIRMEDEAEELAKATGMQIKRTSGDSSSDFRIPFELSDMKLSRLMSSRMQCRSEC